jgi:hypothetical protein
MDDVGPQAAAAAAIRDVKLPPFWPSRPAAWFHLAESRFRLRAIEDPQQKYDFLLSSLPDSVINDVLDVIETAADEENPYEHVKHRLLETHSLSDFEKLELLMKCEPLGGRKPSQLLAEMLQLCPEGEERRIFFHFLFLQKLPVQLRAMLGDVAHGDPRALAARADRLLALNPSTHFNIASVSDDSAAAETTVAAVNQPRGRGRGGRQQQRGRGGNTQNGGNRPRTTPAALAQESAGLCYYHWTFGDKASRCKGDCSWQGN